MRTVSITIGPVVLIALSLDDSVMQHELEVSVARKGSAWMVSGTAEAMSTVLDDIHDRSIAGNWDQPTNWLRACQRTWPKVKAEVETQGFTVEDRGFSGIVILEPANNQ